MSDPEQGWKPSGRPQSTMAQAFSSVLDSAFSLDSDVDQLSQNINYKKQEMMMKNRELEILQAKIREAENRLQGRESSPVEEVEETEEGGSSAPGPKREEQEKQNGSADSNYTTGSSARRTGNREFTVDDRETKQQIGNNS